MVTSILTPTTPVKMINIKTLHPVLMNCQTRTKMKKYVNSTDVVERDST
jgi:hypothetical protein